MVLASLSLILTISTRICCTNTILLLRLAISASRPPWLDWHHLSIGLVFTMIPNCFSNSVLDANKISFQSQEIRFTPTPSHPQKVWDKLTTDFTTHLPSFFNHIVICVVYDRLTKYAHFIALCNK